MHSGYLSVGGASARLKKDLRDRLDKMAKPVKEERENSRERLKLNYGDDFAEAPIVLDAEGVE
jgi:hypothetical protein